MQHVHRRLTVAICGNDPLIVEGIRSTLEDDGGFVIVGSARGVAEALRLVRRERPDVVLLGADGQSLEPLTLLERVLTDHPDGHVILFAETRDPHYAQAAFHRGASGYIVAQIDGRDVPAAIRIGVHETAYHARGLPAVAPGSAAHSAGLTQRERTILVALKQGLSNRQIARELWVTEHTVKFHLTNIYRKAGVSNRIDAVRWAVRRGVV